MQGLATDDFDKFKAGFVIAGRYRVVRRLGIGGMGVVLQVVDSVLNDDVLALKVLYPKHVRDETLFARFRNEVVIARKLSHPNIVRLYDFGCAGDDFYYITMEYVDGINLGSRLREIKEQKKYCAQGKNTAHAGSSQSSCDDLCVINKIDLESAISILVQIARGLHQAHVHDVVHRDLKPDNILLSTSGEAKITDFGLARTLTDNLHLTKTGEAVGTPYYMSPEQIRGEKVDARSDIYALGVIAYELITGEHPFKGDVWLALATAHLTEPTPKIDCAKENIPSWYQDVVNKATEKDRNKRFQNMLEFVSTIERHVGHAVGQSLQTDGSSYDGNHSKQSLWEAVAKELKKRCAWCF